MASTMDRRYNRGVPVFTVSSEAVRREGPGGRAKVHNVGDFPDMQGLMSSRTGVWTAYPAQMLKLRRTQELGCCAGFGSSPRRQVITSGRPHHGRAGDHRRQAQPGSFSPAVPPTCPTPRFAAVIHGQSRSVRLPSEL